MEVIGNFPNCSNIFPALEKLSPDVILLGMNLNSEKELEVILQLIVLSKANVLILKWSQDSKIYDKAILAGAKGIIEKEAPLDTILKAIEKVHEGELWLNQASIKRLINGLSQQSNEKSNSQEKDGIHKHHASDQYLPQRKRHSGGPCPRQCHAHHGICPYQ